VFRRHKYFIILLASLFALSFFTLEMPFSFSIDEEQDPLVSELPYHLGGWQGRDLDLDERTYEILETRNVVSRTYKNDMGEALHLLIVGSQRDRRVAHPPEVCYTGSHYDIVKTESRTIRGDDINLPVKEFIAESKRDPNQRQSVMYLYKVGDRFTSNYYAQQFRFALDRVMKGDSEVLLIRLSGKTKRHFEQFLLNLLPHI